MKFSKSLNYLYKDVKQSILKESTILMQGDEEGASVEEFNNVSKEMLEKIRRLLGPDQKHSQAELLTFLTNAKKISNSTAKKIVLYVEHYSPDPKQVITYILDEPSKLTLQEISGKAVNFIDKLKQKGFNDELIEALISLKEQGSGPGEYLFSITVKDLQKRKKEGSDGGDLELIGEEGGKVELKGNSGILRSGKENTFGTPIDCSRFWRAELQKRMEKYGMTLDLQELPETTAKPGGTKATNLSFKINNANRLTVDIFGKRISQRLKELQNKKTEFNNQPEYIEWLKSENVKLSPQELKQEKFDEEDLITLWAEGFHKLFIKADVNKIIEMVKQAYNEASSGSELGISLRTNLLMLNLDYYISLDNFQYFVLFDHVPGTKTYGKAVVLSKDEMNSKNKAKLLDLISIVSAPDFSRDVVSSGATSIKINSSFVESSDSE